MSATWIRVAAATLSTVAIVASAPMIASATQNHRASSDDRSSTSVSTKDPNHSTGDSQREDSTESDKSHDDGKDGHHQGGGAGGPGASVGSVKANITVGVPAIAFTKDIVSSDGRLRTPVLINASQQAGIATLVRDGVPTSCSVPAIPGVVAWLECTKVSNRGPHAYSVVVRTANGLSVSHPVVVRKSSTD